MAKRKSFVSQRALAEILAVFGGDDDETDAGVSRIRLKRRRQAKGMPSMAPMHAGPLWRRVTISPCSAMTEGEPVKMSYIYIGPSCYASACVRSGHRIQGLPCRPPAAEAFLIGCSVEHRALRRRDFSRKSAEGQQ